MTDVSLCFEVHQPIRLKKEFFWGGSPLRNLPGELFDFYFDHQENLKILQRVSTKCYLPTNKVILETIEEFKEEERPFKVAYSLSGIFMEQCMNYNPEVMDSFKRLVDTDMVELMEQTYYHSLASLYEDNQEFREQVKMHRELVWDQFGVKPTTFENTELLYDNKIAKSVEAMGYKGMFTEGVIAPPNYVYRPKGTEIGLLLRNYQLTDDIGFRFSAQWWNQYPLTADKYATWLDSTPGDCINIFCDYETFGEHHWKETGIFEFLRALPGEILKHSRLNFATPQEILEKHEPVEEISIPKPVSWADIERDTSCWLGNAMQQAGYIYHRRLEAPIKECNDPKMHRIWRTLGLSDHLYYMFTAGGGAGIVHSYFSPYGNPFDAAITYLSVLSDLHFRLKNMLSIADEPFIFTSSEKTPKEMVWSLEALYGVLAKTEIEALEQHVKRGDLAQWARFSLGDDSLARKIEDIEDLEGDELRHEIMKIIMKIIESRRKRRL